MVPLLHSLVLVPPLLLVLKLHMLNCKVMVDHLGMLLVSPDWGRSAAAGSWVPLLRGLSGAADPYHRNRRAALTPRAFFPVSCARTSSLGRNLCGIRFCRKWWHGGVGSRRRWAHGRLSSSLKQSSRICCMSPSTKP